MKEGIELSEVLGALSLTTDLGAGVPFEKGLRTCVVASSLADALDLGDAAVLVAQTDRFAQWAGRKRARQLTARFVAEVPAQGASLARGSCEVSVTLGARLGLSDRAIAALDEVYERYDGTGFPTGHAGDELTIAARVVHVAEQAVMTHYGLGAEATTEHTLRRARNHLDPDICAIFTANPEPILSALEAPDMLAAALEAEPAPRVRVPPAGADRVCTAFATFADLKGKFLLGHSGHVARLADRAAELIGYDGEARGTLRMSALLLDVGRVGISSAVWDRPGKLGPVEWERVRLHSYWTERILRRCRTLERLVPMAATTAGGSARPSASCCRSSARRSSSRTCADSPTPRSPRPWPCLPAPSRAGSGSGWSGCGARSSPEPRSWRRALEPARPWLRPGR